MVHKAPQLLQLVSIITTATQRESILGALLIVLANDIPARERERERERELDCRESFVEEKAAAAIVSERRLSRQQPASEGRKSLNTISFVCVCVRGSMLIKACINGEARDVRPCLFCYSRNFLWVCAHSIVSTMHFNCLSSIELVFFGRMIVYQINCHHFVGWIGFWLNCFLFSFFI